MSSLFLSRLFANSIVFIFSLKSRKGYCTTPSVSIGGGGGSFYVKVFYVMGKALCQASYPVPVTGLVGVYSISTSTIK